MSYLRYMCLLAYSGVHHILCCVFCFVCLRLVCPMFLWIVHFSLPLRYTLTFIYICVYIYACHQPICHMTLASFSL